MNTVTPELFAALSADLTYLCRILVFERLDGRILRFTDHDKNLIIDGEIYQSSQAFTASASNLSLNRLSNDADIACILDSTSLDYAELTQGIYDNAKVQLSIVSYKHLEYGSILLLDGNIKSCVTSTRYAAMLAIRGNLARSQKQICEQYSEQCRANFGDHRCKVDLAPLTFDFTVTTYVYRQQFTSDDLAAHHGSFFARGTIEWVSGRNAGVRVEVIDSVGADIHLLLPVPMPIEPGDTGKITRGCFKTVAACQNYNNLANYRGEPYVPTEEGIRR